ncbi:MAG: hypothetical protein WAU88_01130 [Candidatus Zixiibacteriota bacterium]
MKSHINRLRALQNATEDRNLPDSAVGSGRNGSVEKRLSSASTPTLQYDNVLAGCTDDTEFLSNEARWLPIGNLANIEVKPVS